MRDGRLNDNQIVLARRVGAHTPKGLFLSSPNGGFLHRGCVLPYQHGGGRGSADSTLPHCEKDSIKAGAKWTGSSDLMIEAGVTVSWKCAHLTGCSHARTTHGPAQRAERAKRRATRLENGKARPRGSIFTVCLQRAHAREGLGHQDGAERRAAPGQVRQLGN